MSVETLYNYIWSFIETTCLRFVIWVELHCLHWSTILEIMIGTTDLKLIRKSNFLLKKNQNSPPPSPQTMLMVICTNPSLLLIFSSQHWTGGEGGDVYLGNLVNCDDHVLLYTGVPMNFAQDCRSFKHWMVRCDLSLVEIKFLLV